MSELLSACKALAAMVRDHGTPTADEVRFVAHAALEAGLDPDEHAAVQATLKDGGDYAALVAEIRSDETRRFYFRRLVSATLLDDEINDAEEGYIAKATKAFGYEPAVVDEFVLWLRDGLAWERRGAALLERL